MVSPYNKGDEKNFLVNQTQFKHNIQKSLIKKLNLRIIETILFFMLIALIALTIIGYIKFNYHSKQNVEITLIKKHKPEKLLQSCDNIPNAEKFDCFPRGTASADSCTQRGCCWTQTGTTNGKVPWCYYPKNSQSYKVISIKKFPRGEIIILNKTKPSIYPNDIQSVQIKISFETKSRLRIKITDNENIRYEPPYPEVPVMASFSDEMDYSVVIHKDYFGFAVIRKNTGTVIFDTRDIGRFIFSDQILQLSALIPSKYIYGLGEQRNNFLLSTDWEEITLFNHDSPPRDNNNLYGSHPFYLALEEGGLSHGVFLLNSNAMDIILQPAPAITYRTIGGVFDFYFFLGPSPADVIQQYTDVIGNPFLPPYWALGFHLCRFGLKSLNDTIAFWKRNRDSGIPFDVQWNDIDYMNGRNDFTLSPSFDKLQDFVQVLHKIGMKYVVIVDPGVASRLPKGEYPPYDIGLQQNIFIKNSSNLPLEGEVWNNPLGTVFPDFTHPHTTSYWLQMLAQFYNKVHFDGLWLDMNEISNFVNGSLQGCEDNILDNPPYVPNIEGGRLNYQTLCMSGKHFVSSHYNVHNLIGFAEAITTNFVLAALRMKRPFVLSRSTFPGIGHFAAHWTGDVFSTWDDMKHSVGDIMSFNIFGIPMVGADICGFNGNTTKNLCQRWSQLGAFYPFSRNHNSDDANDQDPAIFDTDFIESTKSTLEIRYRFLPYLYTLFWLAHKNGHTVIRPLFFEFPEDINTYTQNTQFFWGPALLIVPVLTENATTVTSYFPKSVWFDVHTLEWHESNGDYITISAPMNKIPLYIRGGHIIPYQEAAQTTEQSRKNPFGLYVALDENQKALGMLYWDDGDSYLSMYENRYNSIVFECNGATLVGETTTWGYDVNMMLETIYVMGLPGQIASVYINNQNHLKFSFTPQERNLIIQTAQIDLSAPFNVTWS